MEVNMEKQNKMRVYKIFRTILGPIYKFWYCPQVTGMENIPKEGPVVIVGNHIHIMDQCNVIIATKRTIRYMAKKEYFDPQYNEGHHAWFFRSAGCIPVDRKIHDDSAKEAALEVLRDKGILGLFPEGTRNGLKEERAKEIYEAHIDEKEDFDAFYKRVKKCKTSQINYLEELYNNKKIEREDFLKNIDRVDDYLKELVDKKVIKESDYYDHIYLPFKFGAVSMANKTDAKIVPFVITGDYKFRSKNLKITIGKPMSVSDDLEKENKKLRDTMIKMYKDSK
jgi:1-acyl-sn-glycerol-3-phosphate acyltransferase